MLKPDFWMTPAGAFTPAELEELGIEPAPIAIISEQRPFEETTLERHDVGAFRGDEREQKS